MIDAFILALATRLQADERVVLLLADCGPSSVNTLADEFPDRVFNTGVSEVALVGLAAGLAYSGRRPVAMALASFLFQRAFEFVRNDVAIPRADVKLVGIGGGLAFPGMGVSHH